MNLNTLIHILFARKLTIIGMTLLGLIIAGVLTFFMPKIYTATTELIVDGKGQDPISGQVLQGRLSAAYIGTQADIIRSRKVANKVIDQQNLMQHAGLAKELHLIDNEQAKRRALLSYLRSGLDVTPKSDSSVLRISFAGRNPELAAQLADAFSTAYIKTNLELRIEPAKQITQWYEEQLASLRENLIKRQNILSTYQEKHNILASSDRFDLESAKLAELSSMLIAAQSERLKDTSRNEQITGRNRGALPSQALDNPQVQRLTGQLAEAQAKLGDLATKVGENHPQYRQAQGEVDSVRYQLDQALRFINGSLRSSVELSQSREAKLTLELAAQRERVMQLSRTRNELTLLQQEVDNAQAAYDAALARSATTKLESQIVQTDISVLNVASVPTNPTSPKPLIALFLAGITGLLFGIGTALCWEWFDRRVRNTHDLEGLLDLAVLAYIPADNSGSFRKGAAA